MLKKYPEKQKSRWKEIRAGLNNKFKIRSLKSKWLELQLAQKNKDKPEEMHWSQSQQKQLESGLKKYPKTMNKRERWAKIAEGVEGKNLQQTVRRYKFLVQQLKNQNAN